MTKLISTAAGVALVLFHSAMTLAELKPEMIRRGKSATALVEVALAKRSVTGSAFCVDKSGLFITNAHVVAGASGDRGKVQLVLDIGSASERSVPAEVLRHDDRLDLALLQVGADDRLTPLDLGRESGLIELAEVFTLGYPFGTEPAVGRARYPDITILPSHITSLRRDKGELLAIQFDNQINPGNSGGPVLDSSGKVVGVARATVVGAALNMAIPIGQLAEFLEAPGLSFELPEVSYFERAQPAAWTIRLTPPRPQSPLPEDVSVVLRVSNGGGQPRAYTAKAVSPGIFEAAVTPAPHDPDWRVNILPTTAAGGQNFTMRVKDEDVHGGATRFIQSVLRTLMGGRAPRTQASEIPATGARSVRLAKATRKEGTKAVSLDLNEAEYVGVQTTNPPRVQTLDATVEVRKGSRVLATVRQRRRITAPAGIPVGLKANLYVSITPRPSSPPRFQRPPVDEGLIKLGGVIETDGIPRGAGKAISPARIEIPPARIDSGTPGAREPALVRRLDGTINDLAVGGGGRFLVLVLKDAQKIAVFDANTADIVKTINLPSQNALVAAGARKFLVVFPDEKVLQRWDLGTLSRDGGNRPSPIDGRLIRLAMGSDSDGPILARWFNEEAPGVRTEAQFSFIDLESLTVLRVGLIALTGSRGLVSSSGGSFTIQGAAQEARIRAAPGGALFGIWGGGSPSGFRTLSVRGRVLISPYEHSSFGHVVPGPDGLTIFTGLKGRLDLDGNLPGGGAPPDGPPVVTIPSCDPSYYLTIAGLGDALTAYVDYSRANYHPSRGPVTASIHAADGTRLVTVHGLDEMPIDTNDEVRAALAKSELTLDQRFHLIPAAHLLITIPVENDRLLLRRLDLDEVLNRNGGSDLVVTSAPVLAAAAGQKLEHQLTVRSKQSGVTYVLAAGPDGLQVAPDGMIRWVVPRTQKGEDVTATIRIQDRSSQERLHRLLIVVK
jgi:hypothetical protein